MTRNSRFSRILFTPFFPIQWVPSACRLRGPENWQAVGNAARECGGFFSLGPIRAQVGRSTDETKRLETRHTPFEANNGRPFPLPERLRGRGHSSRPHPMTQERGSAADWM